MTDPVDQLAAQQGAVPDAITAAEQLAALLDLGSVGVTIRGARIVGRGSRASADIYLSDKTEVNFETLRDVAHQTRLAVEIAACTGATPKLNPRQAVQAVALLRALAEHHETFTADQIATAWGVEFLQGASDVPVDIDDQVSRWAAWSELEAHRPDERGRPGDYLVLVDREGDRLVRAGWFRAFVRAEDTTVSPQEIAHRMLRVGWQRRGADGRVKATRPGHHGQLVWPFYIVPAGWENSP